MILDHLIKRMPEEKLVLFVRRHALFLFGELLLIVFLALVPIGLGLIVMRVWPDLASHQLARPVGLLLLSLYLVNLWLFALTVIVDYYLDGWVVTNRRVLSVEQHGLFSRTVSELDLSRVQDVTSEEKGIMAFVFGYGTVFVQTAGETGRFDFERVPHPEAVRKIVLELVDKEIRRDYGNPPPTEASPTSPKQ